MLNCAHVAYDVTWTVTYRNKIYFFIFQLILMLVLKFVQLKIFYLCCIYDYWHVENDEFSLFQQHIEIPLWAIVATTFLGCGYIFWLPCHQSVTDTDTMADPRIRPRHGHGYRHGNGHWTWTRAQTRSQTRSMTLTWKQLFKHALSQTRSNSATDTYTATIAVTGNDTNMGTATVTSTVTDTNSVTDT